MDSLNPQQFTWSRWRRCYPYELFGFRWRKHLIMKNRKMLLECIEGYCKGESLYCRRKENHYAIMFFVNGEYCWCHVRAEEFKCLNEYKI